MRREYVCNAPVVREGESVARDWEEQYREERKVIEDAPNVEAILFICYGTYAPSSFVLLFIDACFFYYFLFSLGDKIGGFGFGM